MNKTEMCQVLWMRWCGDHAVLRHGLDLHLFQEQGVVVGARKVLRLGGLEQVLVQLFLKLAIHLARIVLYRHVRLDHKQFVQLGLLRRLRWLLHATARWRLRPSAR